MRAVSTFLCCVLVLCASACSSDAPVVAGEDASASLDASAIRPDAGVADEQDAGAEPMVDATVPDTGVPDTGVPDTGVPLDASTPADSGYLSDAASHPGDTGLSWGWQPVAIGGGGYVTGLLVHPAADVVYARTDVGGAYRWDEAGSRWLPLLDWVTNGAWYNVASVAVHPSEPDTVALLCANGSPMVLYSTDRGAHFQQAVTQAAANGYWPGEAISGNSRDARWGGERLLISTDRTLWVATRGQGLWRGTPAGSTWTWSREAIPGVADTATVRAIAQGSDGTLWAAVQDDHVHARTPAGTWSVLSGLDLSGTADVLRLAASGSTVWATTGTPSQTSAAATGKVWRGSSAGFQDVTPTGQAPANGWGALTVQGDTAIVVGNLMTNPPILMTVNAGAAWTKAGPVTSAERKRQLTSTVPWWPEFFYADHAAGLALDPRRPGRAWLTDFYGIWRTDDLSAAEPHWTAYDRGHEETIPFLTLGLPGGGLLSGFADITGFTHDDLTKYPSATDVSKPWNETVGGDYARSRPQVRYRGMTKDNTNNAVVRFDGTTWTTEAAYPDRLAYDLAVSATDPELVLAVALGGKPLRRDPSTRAWSLIDSLQVEDGTPSDIYVRDRPLAADEVDGATFYFYDRGQLYVSLDGGLTFATRGPAITSTKTSSVAAVPGVVGEVWVGLGSGGLHRFTNRGNTHAAVAGVTDAAVIAFGATLPGSTRPALYLTGNAGAGNGVYVAAGVPAGAGDWRKISDDTTPLAKLRTLGASPDVPGLVFLGGSGRGIYFGSLR